MKIEKNENNFTIHIPVSTKKPINLHELVTDTNNHIKVIIEPHASVTIHDTVLYECKNVIRNITYTVQDNAQCTIVYHQNVSPQTDFIDHMQIYAHDHATVSIACLLTGGQKTSWYPSLHAVGKHAHITVSGAFIAKNVQQNTIHALQKHTALNTISHVKIHGIIADHAQGDYQGMVHIANNAPGSDASQHNKNMLLHETATMRSIPSLEALNSEVRCGHGSAIGYFDDASLFYLMARGIPKKDAKKLILNAFLAGVLDNRHFAYFELPLKI